MRPFASFSFLHVAAAASLPHNAPEEEQEKAGSEG